MADMKNSKCFVIRNDDTGDYLCNLYLGKRCNVKPIWSTRYLDHAYLFENQEEAAATIAFIGDVLDFELAESLIVVCVSVAHDGSVQEDPSDA